MCYFLSHGVHVYKTAQNLSKLTLYQKNSEHLLLLGNRKFGHVIGVFSKWSRTFIEFSEFREFRESEKSLRHELGSV